MLTRYCCVFSISKSYLFDNRNNWELFHKIYISCQQTSADSLVILTTIVVYRTNLLLDHIIKPIAIPLPKWLIIKDRMTHNPINQRYPNPSKSESLCLIIDNIWHWRTHKVIRWVIDNFLDCLHVKHLLCLS